MTAGRFRRVTLYFLTLQIDFQQRSGWSSERVSIAIDVVVGAAAAVGFILCLFRQDFFLEPCASVASARHIML